MMNSNAQSTPAEGENVDTDTVNEVNEPSSAPPVEQGPEANPNDDVGSIWHAYLSGKLALKGFKKAVSERGISIPTAGEIEALSELATGQPKVYSRLLALLDEFDRDSNRVLAEGLVVSETLLLKAGVVRDGIPRSSHDVDRWLQTIPRRPLKATNLSLLQLAIRLGTEAGWLNEADAFDLAGASVTRPLKKPKRSDALRRGSRPIDALIAAGSSVPALKAASICFRAIHERTRIGENALYESERARTELLARVAALEVDISRVNDERRNLERETAELTKRLDDLKSETANTADGYRHKIQALQTHVRGTLNNDLRRLLDAAKDAAAFDPPWVQAVVERLEDMDSLIMKEIEWLQRSE
jgi:hypothetical protein